MMSKVVDDEDALALATYFRASLHVFESRERVRNLFAADAPRSGGDDHRETVQQVELPKERRLKFSPRTAFAKHCKLRHRAAEIGVAHLPLCVVRRAECLERGKKS